MNETNTLCIVNESLKTVESSLQKQIENMKAEFLKTLQNKIEQFCKQYNCFYRISRHADSLFMFKDTYDNLAFETYYCYFRVPTNNPFRLSKIFMIYDEMIFEYNKNPQSFYHKYTRSSFDLKTHHDTSFSSDYNPEKEKQSLQKLHQCFDEILTFNAWYQNGLSLNIDLSEIFEKLPTITNGEDLLRNLEN